MWCISTVLLTVFFSFSALLPADGGAALVFSCGAAGESGSDSALWYQVHEREDGLEEALSKLASDDYDERRQARYTLKRIVEAGDESVIRALVGYLRSAEHSDAVKGAVAAFILLGLIRYQFYRGFDDQYESCVRRVVDVDDDWAANPFYKGVLGGCKGRGIMVPYDPIVASELKQHALDAGEAWVGHARQNLDELVNAGDMKIPSVSIPVSIGESAVFFKAMFDTLATALAGEGEASQERALTWFVSAAKELSEDRRQLILTQGGNRLEIKLMGVPDGINVDGFAKAPECIGYEWEFAGE